MSQKSSLAMAKAPDGTRHAVFQGERLLAGTIVSGVLVHSNLAMNLAWVNPWNDYHTNDSHRNRSTL